MSKKENSKLTKTAYLEIEKKLIRDIKPDKNKKNRKSKLIHIHAPFGKGKSYLIESLSNSVGNKGIEIYDEALRTEDMIDSIFNRNGKNKNDYRKIAKGIKIKRAQKSLSKSIIWAVSILVTIALAFIPIYQKEDYDIYIRLVPAFVSAPLVILFILYASTFNVRARKTIVIENIDRSSWDIIIYAFQKAYSSKNIVIFTYSTDNIKSRYLEKYNQENANMYSLIEKYVDKSYDLQKYDGTAGQIIVKELLDKFGVQEININLDCFLNYRLLERTLIYVKENEKLIKILNKNKQIVFDLYYLSISDAIAYKWIKESFDGYNVKNPATYKWWQDMSYSFAIKAGGTKSILDEPPAEVMNSYHLVKQICLEYNNNSDERGINSYILNANSSKLANEIEKIKGSTDSITLLSKSKLVPERIKQIMLPELLQTATQENIDKNFVFIYGAANVYDQELMINNFKYTKITDPWDLIEVVRTIFHKKKFTFGLNGSPRRGDYLYTLPIKEYLKTNNWISGLNDEDIKACKKLTKRVVLMINKAIKLTLDIDLKSLTKTSGYKIYEMLLIKSSAGQIKNTDYKFVKKLLQDNNLLSTGKKKEIDVDIFLGLFSGNKGWSKINDSVNGLYRFDEDSVKISDLTSKNDDLLSYWKESIKYIRGLSK